MAQHVAEKEAQVEGVYVNKDYSVLDIFTACDYSSDIKESP